MGSSQKIHQLGVPVGDSQRRRRRVNGGKSSRGLNWVHR